jgi:hypothetical protein
VGGRRDDWEVDVVDVIGFCIDPLDLFDESNVFFVELFSSIESFSSCCVGR